jgi:hypothetical protein
VTTTDYSELIISPICDDGYAFGGNTIFLFLVAYLSCHAEL